MEFDEQAAIGHFWQARRGGEAKFKATVAWERHDAEKRSEGPGN